MGVALRNARLVLLWAPLTLAACGGSPSAPTPPPPVVPPVGTPVSASHLISTPVSPANGEAIDYRATPVTLVVTVPAPPAGALIIDTFEYDENEGFTSPSTKAVPRQSTSTSLSVTVLSSQIGKEFFWRVRSSSGEMLGPHSATSRFRVPGESLRPPVLMEPAIGAIIAAKPKLRVTKVLHMTDASWAYDFEIATDDAFRSVVETGRVTENNTSLVNFTANAELATGRYFWRARAVDGRGQASNFTSAWTFEVRAPFATAPALLSPSPGAIVTQSPAFTLRNGPLFTSPTGTRYEVQLSLSPLFDSVAAAGWDWPSSGEVTTVTLRTNLSGGTYYWRARSVTIKDATRPDIASNWTESRAVMLAGLVLGTPQVASPLNKATTTLRPTLRVGNVTRNGSGGGLVYRFEVSTDNQFVLPSAAIGTVPEGSGSTAWTVPFDLPVGVSLWWRVQASDLASGTVGPFSSMSRFAAVDTRTHLYTLTLAVPATCGFRNSAPALLVQSEDLLGAARVRLRAQDADQATADSLVLDLTRDSAGAFAGTILGSGNGSGQVWSYFVSADQNSSSAPATIVGVSNGFGMSGTFTGRVRESAHPQATATCSSAAFSWSVTPSVQ